MVNDQSINERIRARARRLWEEEGRPEGRAEAHWEQARLIVALEDSQHTMLKPIQAPVAEPIEAVRNLGEFPTLTDQGEEQAYPSSRSETILAKVSAGRDEEPAQLESLSPSRDGPYDIMRIASEFARHYAAFAFLTAAAAGFALSRILKAWFRDRPGEPG